MQCMVERRHLADIDYEKVGSLLWSTETIIAIFRNRTKSKTILLDGDAQ